MTYNFKTIEEAVTEYIRVLNTPPNGWGQHIDQMGRQSHFLLAEIQAKFGKVETDRELDRQFTAQEQLKIRSMK